MLGMGPILWEIAFRRFYKLYGDVGIPPASREDVNYHPALNPAAVVYYKMLDRANLNLPIL